MRVKRMFCSFLFQFFLFNLFSQSFASFPSLGSISTSNVQQAFSNPSLQAEKPGWDFALGFKKNFNLPNIKYIEAIVRHKWNDHSGLSLTFNSDRFLDLSRSQFGIGISKQLQANFHLGVYLQLQKYKILEYGSRTTASFKLGILHQISDELQIYTSADSPFNFGQVEVFKSKAMAGINYQISPLVLCQLRVEKEYHFALNIIPGIEYEINQQLYLNVQYFSSSSAFQFGIGGRLKNNFQLNISILMHPMLDWNPGFNLTYF